MYLMAALPLSTAAIYFVSIDAGSSTRQMSQAPKLVVIRMPLLATVLTTYKRPYGLFCFGEVYIPPHDVKGYRYLFHFSGQSSWRNDSMDGNRQ